MALAPAPGLELADLSEVELVEVLRAAEEEKCRLEALKVEVTARLDEVVRRRHAAAGVRAEKQGAGVASQVALARRESPNRGARHLGLAKILVAELPHTLAAMRAGWCSEWRATLVARETACLSLEDRRRVDAELMADPETTEGWGDQRLVAAARARAYELDPHAALKRSRKAEGERHVSLRPAPDTMTWLTALLPVAQGVSAYAALARAADQARAAGDERSRGQVMADALVASLTTPHQLRVRRAGASSWPGAGGGQPDRLGRDPARRRPCPGLDRRVRPGAGRVRTRPGRHRPRAGAGDAAAALHHQQRCPGRDGLPLPHLPGRAGAVHRPARPVVPHPVVRRPDPAPRPRRPRPRRRPHQRGNGQGLCEACNQAKEAPGFAATVHDGVVTTTTPTGHQVRSRAPALPPGDPPAREPRGLGPVVHLYRHHLQVVLADDFRAA